MTKFIHEENGRSVTLETDQIVLRDLLEDFKSFCLAMGYSEKTVINAFNDTYEEEI